MRECVYDRLRAAKGPYVPLESRDTADAGDGVVMYPDGGPRQGPLDTRLPGLMSHASHFGEQVHPATARARSSTCCWMWAFSAFLGPRPHVGSKKEHPWCHRWVAHSGDRALSSEVTRSRCGPAIVLSSDNTPICWHLFLFILCVLACLTAPRHCTGFCLFTHYV